MIEIAQRNDTRVVIELSGPLDARSAERLASIASQQPSGVRIVIDISCASVVHDSALVRLVAVLPRSRSHSIRGANRHQAEVLARLGEPLEEDPWPARKSGAQD